MTESSIDHRNVDLVEIFRGAELTGWEAPPRWKGYYVAFRDGGSSCIEIQTDDLIGAILFASTEARLFGVPLHVDLNRIATTW